MADAIQMAIALLQADGPFTSLADVMGGVLREKYDPFTMKPAVVLSVRGGVTESEAPIQDVSVQVKVWSNTNQFVIARAVYNALFKVLHGATNVNFGAAGRLIRSVEDMVGQDITDPDMGWATVVGAFSMKIVQGDTAITDPITPTQTIQQYVDAAIAAALASLAGMDDNL